MNNITSHQLRRVQLVSAAKPDAEGGLLRAVLVAAAKGAFAALAVIGLLFVGVLVGDREPVQHSAPKASKVTT
jgi:hypothetical protein